MLRLPKLGCSSLVANNLTTDTEKYGCELTLLCIHVHLQGPLSSSYAVREMATQRLQSADTPSCIHQLWGLHSKLRNCAAKGVVKYCV